MEGLIERDKSDSPVSLHGQLVGVNVNFQRYRRITGYLTGDITSWNNAKRCELKDRVKHSMACGQSI